MPMPDNALLLDLYELTMAQAYFYYKPRAMATFDLFVRKLPPGRNYLIACGLSDILAYLKNLRFSKEDLQYLGSLKLFSPDFLRYLAAFKFRGDVWAMPEGTIFFAQEPVIRVTSAIIEAQIIESFLLNTVNLQTMIASKASRIVSSAAGRPVFDFSLRRTHGSEAGIKVARSSYIAGFSGTATVEAGKLYGIPVIGTMAHSFVMSFEREIESFFAYSRVFPDKSTFLVDTYEVKKGIANAVAAGLYLKEKGYLLRGIRLDSGDIVYWSRLARRALDSRGLRKVGIVATGNLDEFKIKKLLQKGAPIDSFGVGTNMGVSIDAPCLDVVYKLSEVSGEAGRFLPTMKLSCGKATYPGRKQVFRIRSKTSGYSRDILALESEPLRGEPLLRKAVAGGRVIYPRESLERIRRRAASQLAYFSPRLKTIDCRYRYPLIISGGLTKTMRSLARQLCRKQ
ncbi:MAG: nicotinate phosphoribosyltransferase [Candidatus Omnitrophota bacterium]